jgi:SAM-dependent methyltransferase
MITALKKLYKKEQFFPGIIGIFINPFYFARKGLAEGIRIYGKFITGKTLDVGCGQKPYASVVQSSAYIGLEIDTPENRKNKKADIFYDGHHFPFVSSSFDSLLANQVFEHVFNPGEFLHEVNRVLTIDGTLLLTVPFVWDEHEQPFDYARYSSFGLQSLLRDYGFEIVSHRKSINDIRVIFQLLNDYIYKKTLTKNVFINQCSVVLLMAPINLLGILSNLLLPKNNDLYLDNIILAKKVRNV